MKVPWFIHLLFLLALVFIIVSIVTFVKGCILKGALWLGVAAVCWFIGFYHNRRLFKPVRLFMERDPEKFKNKKLYSEQNNIINDVNIVCKTDHEPFKKNKSDLYEIMFKDIDNPAFNMLINNYSLNIAPFSMIADIIIEVAAHSASHLANANSKGINKNIIHLFYDLYLALNSKLYHSDDNKSSIIIDGMHIKYFGQPSFTVVETLMKLRAIKEECFLTTFFSRAKEPSFFWSLGTFLSYFLDSGECGVTEVSFNSETIIDILKTVSPKLKNDINTILRNNPT